jgi:hypothetical protein
MVPLGDSLPNGLHDRLQLLGRDNDASLDELELGGERLLELLHAVRVLVDVPDRLLRVGVVPHQVVLAHDWAENVPEMLGEFRA